ncbi:MAG: hypothetical protein ACRDQ9_15895 [Pseudonocardiaceae bacterium]
MVVPLQVRGLSRTIAFERADGCLVSRSSRLFGFVPMQGAGAHQDHAAGDARGRGHRERGGQSDQR